ncbi:MAG: hypothetical protein AAB276_06355 [Pseudomonadota bacterium]
MRQNKSGSAASLITAFGGPTPNRAAIDVANNFSGTVCPNLLQKVYAALSSRQSGFVRPRLGQMFGWMRPLEPR